MALFETLLVLLLTCSLGYGQSTGCAGELDMHGQHETRPPVVPCYTDKGTTVFKIAYSLYAVTSYFYFVFNTSHVTPRSTVARSQQGGGAGTRKQTVNLFLPQTESSAIMMESATHALQSARISGETPIVRVSGRYMCVFVCARWPTKVSVRCRRQGMRVSLRSVRRGRPSRARAKWRGTLRGGSRPQRGVPDEPRGGGASN